MNSIVVQLSILHIVFTAFSDYVEVIAGVVLFHRGDTIHNDTLGLWGAVLSTKRIFHMKTS